MPEATRAEAKQTVQNFIKEGFEGAVNSNLDDYDESHVFKKLYKNEIRKIGWRKEKIQGPLKNAMGGVETSAHHNVYGHIATWDVREVTNMEKAFEGKYYRDLDLSFWDTRGVSIMDGAFENYQGDVEVGMWDTKEVVSMSFMFSGASYFNCDIGSWNMSKVQRASSMFKGAAKFNQDLRRWNLGSLLSYDNMFAGSGIDNEEAKKPKKALSGNANDSSGFGQAANRAFV